MTTRNTIQRVRILDFLKNSYAHPTAEAVFQEVVKELPTITLATVYRNLNILTKESIILRLKVDNTYHFDGRECDNHAHGICKECGKVFDINQKIPNKMPSHKDFIPEEIKIIYKGTCKKCLR